MGGLRVMVVHNRYRSATPSGENIVVDREVRLLTERGHAVSTFFRSNDDYERQSTTGRIRLWTAPLTGRPALDDFRDRLRAERPDVVHVHNVYPLISPAVIRACAAAGVPVVATVHNFRLRCIRGDFFRDGTICTACEDRRLGVPGVVHGCYAESRPASAVMTAAQARHRSTWEGVARFIAVSDFVAERLVGWGVPEARIAVVPNPVDDPGAADPPGDGFVFAARLQEEKGALLLLDAWERSDLGGTTELRIAGDGPLRDEIERRTARLAGATALGPLSYADVTELRRRSAVGVQCSLCFEAHPSVGESFALGRPVVATRLGGAAAVVDQDVGWLAEPTPDDLARQLVAATDRDEVRARGRAARGRYEAAYHPARVGERLEDVFASVVTNR